MTEVRVEVRVDVRAFMAALRRTRERSHPIAVSYMSPRVKRRHVARCDWCNPMANPSPLSIDGHAYHRKTRARRRNR